MAIIQTETPVRERARRTGEKVVGKEPNQRGLAADLHGRGGNLTSDLSGAAFDNNTEIVTFLGSIGGSVADTDGPRNGTVVTLYLEGSTTPVAEVTTSATGAYSFIGLPPGDYCVRFQHAADETVLSTSGSATGAESDGDQVCGIGIVLGANRAVTDVDALMVDPSAACGPNPRHGIGGGRSRDICDGPCRRSGHDVLHRL